MQIASSISIPDRPGPAAYVPKQRLLSLGREQVPAPGRLLHVIPPVASSSRMMGGEAEDPSPTPQVLLGAVSSAILMSPCPQLLLLPSSKLARPQALDAASVSLFGLDCHSLQSSLLT